MTKLTDDLEYNGTIAAFDGADKIKRLHAILIAARPYVETCADDALPNPAADVLKNIDAALAA